MNQDTDLLVGDEQRSLAELRHHYEVEKALASRLRQATRSERKIIYSTMYEELFKQVPDHSRLSIRYRGHVACFILRGQVACFRI